MESQRFDDLTKRIGVSSRRRFLGGIVGIAGVLVGGRPAVNETEAARRGYSGPPLPTPAPRSGGHIWVHHGCIDGCGCHSCSYDENEFVVFDTFIMMDLRSGPCPYSTRQECCVWAVEMNSCDMDR